MNVALECGNNDLTIWFGLPATSSTSSPVDGLPQCDLVTDGSDKLHGFRFRCDLTSLCPHELAKTSAANSGTQINASFHSSYDQSCDMGYIYFDQRGPASVDYSIDCGTVVLDVGHDGAIIGLEIFSPSKTLPLLASLRAT